MSFVFVESIPGCECGLKTRCECSILGSKNSSLADVGMTEETLLRWYFVDVLGESVPNDLAAYLTELGYETADALFRTLLDEYVFRHHDAAGGVVSSRGAEPRSANRF
jgi:hypothetical protein